MNEESEKPIGVLSIGEVLGGPTPENMGWDEAVGSLTGAVMRARKGLDTDGVRLNVVFHIAGKFVQQSFEGARTGSYSKADRLLMVQVALPEVAPPDAFEQVLARAYDAVAAVEPWSKRRKVPFESELFTAMLDSLEIVDRDPSTMPSEVGACLRTFKTPRD